MSMDAQPGYFDLIGFGPGGWGPALIAAAGMTVAVAGGGFLLGSVIGGIVAALKLSRVALLRMLADIYITVLRGVPDLLVIYLLYFGGSSAFTAVGEELRCLRVSSASRLFHRGLCARRHFWRLSGGIVPGRISRAQQGRTRGGSLLRHASLAHASSHHRSADHPLRIPGMGNIWQLALKESALISVVGLVEILRQSQLGAGATYRPFDFYITAFFLYLLITWVSGHVFKWAERRSLRGVRIGGVMDWPFLLETFASWCSECR